ncbi:polyhydroxyalkanoic acid system family protein [Stenotrophomonas sp. NPDC077464]|uniref:polyhydroxyalkanoic acid system family protein n=1 Tax=unclassified Stenotrophomonas TaxID=196198 RepID=UPI0037CEB4A8
MSSIDIRHDHTHSADVARSVIEDMVVKLDRKFPLKTEWVDDALNFSGAGVKGLIALLPGQVHVTANLSFPASLMQSTVEGEIQRVLREKLG